MINSFKILRFIAFLLVMILGANSDIAVAKKIKKSFKIEREKEGKEGISRGRADSEVVEINLFDTITDAAEPSVLMDAFKQCGFTGYDKELSSNLESFIIVNVTDKTITGFKVKIDYLDMKGRMFHSREVRETCDVPPGESRRVDIKSWDKQHTYYYYLGNEPRKVATPYKVTFTPLTYWINE